MANVCGGESLTCAWSRKFRIIIFILNWILFCPLNGISRMLFSRKIHPFHSHVRQRIRLLFVAGPRKKIIFVYVLDKLLML